FGVELVARGFNCCDHSFAQNRVGEIGAAGIESSSASSATAASCSHQGGAAALGLAITGYSGQDFRGAGVDHARADAADRFGIALLHAAQAKLAEPISGAADCRLVIVAAKSCDGADDDGVHAQDLAYPGGAGGIGSITVGEILFGENFV